MNVEMATNHVAVTGSILSGYIIHYLRFHHP